MLCCCHLKSFIWSVLTCGFRLRNIHDTHTQSRTGTVTDKFYQFVKQISPSSSLEVKQKCNIEMLTISDVCHVLHIAVFKKPVFLIFPFGHTVNLVLKTKYLLHLCWNYCTTQPKTQPCQRQWGKSGMYSKEELNCVFKGTIPKHSHAKLTKYNLNELALPAQWQLPQDSSLEESQRAFPCSTYRANLHYKTTAETAL